MQAIYGQLNLSNQLFLLCGLFKKTTYTYGHEIIPKSSMYLITYTKIQKAEGLHVRDAGVYSAGTHKLPTLFCTCNHSYPFCHSSQPIELILPTVPPLA